jgi:hypothetical protein
LIKGMRVLPAANSAQLSDPAASNLKLLALGNPVIATWQCAQVVI